METERIALSQQERDRLRVLHQVQQKQLTQIVAAQRLKVTDRQVRRMLQRIRQRGDSSLLAGIDSLEGANHFLEMRFLPRVGTAVHGGSAECPQCPSTTGAGTAPGKDLECAGGAPAGNSWGHRLPAGPNQGGWPRFRASRIAIWAT